jgi:hypothetical protein
MGIMRIQNTGTPIAIPGEGIGLLQPDEIFEVDDALGYRLLGLERFREVDENDEPVRTLEPLGEGESPSFEPGTISDPEAYERAKAEGRVGEITGTEETTDGPPGPGTQLGPDGVDPAVQADSSNDDPPFRSETEPETTEHE